MNMTENVWNRDELYEKVWSMPVTKVAKEFGVSDVAIAKTCRKLKVPLPGRGYWAKKANGYTVTRTPLPKLKEPLTVERTSLSPLAAKVPSPPLHPDDQSEFSRVDRLVLGGAFAFSRDPKILKHPLIVKTRRALRESHADERKILRPGYMSEALDVRVAAKSVGRTMEVLASMIACAEAHDGKINVVQSDQDSRTIFEAHGQSVGFSIHETARQRYLDTVPPPTKGRYAPPPTFGRKPVEYMPTGKLTLEIASYEQGLRRNWKEGRKTLPDLQPEIMATLFKFTILQRRLRLKQKAEHEARQRREAELQQLRRRIEEEERRVQQLCEEATNWEKARAIRQYVLTAIDVRKQAEEDLGPDTPLGIWVAWALQQADRLDPLVKNPPSILDRKKELPPQAKELWRLR